MHKMDKSQKSYHKQHYKGKHKIIYMHKYRLTSSRTKLSNLYILSWVGTAGADTQNVRLQQRIKHPGISQNLFGLSGCPEQCPAVQTEM